MSSWDVVILRTKWVLILFYLEEVLRWTISNVMIVEVVVNCICQESYGCSYEKLYVLKIVLFSAVVSQGISFINTVQLTLAISTSLISNTRLSRSEIWSLPKHENLTTCKNIMEKIFTIFSIYLSSRVQLYIYLLNVVSRICFSSLLQIWYVEVRIYRSISESPLEFEITRVDCISFINTDIVRW